MPSESDSRKLRFIPVFTIGNVIAPLLTAGPIVAALLIWGGRIDQRVDHVEMATQKKAELSSLAEVDRRLTYLEADARSINVLSATIREPLGVMTGELRAQRALVETLVNQTRGSRGDARP